MLVTSRCLEAAEVGQHGSTGGLTGREQASHVHRVTIYRTSPCDRPMRRALMAGWACAPFSVCPESRSRVYLPSVLHSSMMSESSAMQQGGALSIRGASPSQLVPGEEVLRACVVSRGSSSRQGWRSWDPDHTAGMGEGALQQQARPQPACRELPCAAPVHVYVLCRRARGPAAGCLHVACMGMPHTASAHEAGEAPTNRRLQLAATSPAGPPESVPQCASLHLVQRISCMA